jgi:hypothetical protein
MVNHDSGMRMVVTAPAVWLYWRIDIGDGANG